MVPFFPNQISYRAIAVYFCALLAVNLYFYHYAMLFGYMVLGSVMVTGFFMLTHIWSSSWRGIPDKWFVKRLFGIAFGIRIIWVVASFFYYIAVTGVPFEIDAADSIGYYNMAEWWHGCSWSEIWMYAKQQSQNGISDLGYPLYLTILSKLFGLNVIVPRIIKALISAYTCILLYRVSSRSFGEETGRMAGIPGKVGLSFPQQENIDLEYFASTTTGRFFVLLQDSFGGCGRFLGDFRCCLYFGSIHEKRVEEVSIDWMGINVSPGSRRRNSDDRVGRILGRQGGKCRYEKGGPDFPRDSMGAICDRFCDGSDGCGPAILDNDQY